MWEKLERLDRRYQFRCEWLSSFNSTGLLVISIISMFIWRWNFLCIVDWPVQTFKSFVWFLLVLLRSLSFSFVLCWSPSSLCTVFDAVDDGKFSLKFPLMLVFSKAPCVVLFFSRYTLMVFLIMLSLKFLSTLSVTELSIFGDN